MLGFIFTLCLAALTPQLQANTQSLQFEVQFLEWNRPVDSSSNWIFTKVPDDANVFACMTVSASVGKPFHAQARFGSETLELSGLVRAIKGADVEYELEVEHSKDVPLREARKLTGGLDA